MGRHAACTTAGVTLAFYAAVVLATVCLLPLLGREFMPELEEGNMMDPRHVPCERRRSRKRPTKADAARKIIARYPEVRWPLRQIGRPDDGTDPTGYYNVECFVPLSCRRRMAGAARSHPPAAPRPS